VRRNGFTLIEVSVILALLAVVSTIGVFTYRSIITNTQQTTTVTRLHQAAIALETEQQRTGGFPTDPDVLAGLSPALGLRVDPQTLEPGEGVAVAVFDDGSAALAALDHQGHCLLLRIHPPGTRVPSASGYGQAPVCDPQGAAELDGRQW
jgi:prepilin-type N-terminal cleavage/methylation domain-containing protein